MPYLLNTPEDQRAMLEAIGVGSLDELFARSRPSCGWRGSWTFRRP